MCGLKAKLGIYVVTLLMAVLSSQSQQRFPLSLSVAQFRIDSNWTRVEFAYSIPDTELVFRSVSQHPALARAVLELQLNIRSSLYSDSTTVLLEAFKTDRDSGASLLIGKRVFHLPPDQYTVYVRIRDALYEHSKLLERSFPLVVRRFANDELTSSTVELAQWITRWDSLDARQVNTAFVKNGFYVVPNPTAAYEGTEPLLYAYTELYNLDRCRCDSIGVHYRILDAAMNEAFDLRYRRPVLAPAQAEVLKVSLDGLPTGVYYLSLSLELRDGVEMMLGRQQFYLINPELPPQQPIALSEEELFLQSPFSTMDEAQLNLEISSARFVASAKELDAYYQLTDLAAKRRFLFRFWLQRDPDPSTPVNERYEEFRKAREYAAKFYRTPRFPEGWNSDRGRVLLKYGFPTQIDRAYFNMDGAHPHEIWRYDNVQGGVIFVFVDQQGTENFVLVHSTALNEIRNENWYRQFALPNYLDPNRPIR